MAVCLAFGVAAGLQAAPEKTRLTVYVPCGMVNPFYEAMKIFRKKHPNIDVRPEIANVLVLRNKVRDGARPDVLLTLGMRELKPLYDQNLIPQNGTVKIGTIPLAIVAPKGNPGKIKTLKDFAAPAVKSVAIGDPKMVSVGFGAMTALQNLGVWEKVQEKSVTPRMPSQVMSYVSKRRVEASVVYKPCLMEELGVTPTGEMRATRVQFVADVPQKLYDQIACGAVAINGANHPDLAMALVRFLGSDASKAIFHRWWFGKL